MDEELSPPGSPKPLNDFEESLLDFAEFSAGVQRDISDTLLASPTFQAAYKQTKNTSEEVAAKTLDQALERVCSLMPLATDNGQNLFVTLLGAHGSITGDPTIPKAIKRINEHIIEGNISDE